MKICRTYDELKAEVGWNVALDYWNRRPVMAIRDDVNGNRVMIFEAPEGIAVEPFTRERE